MKKPEYPTCSKCAKRYCIPESFPKGTVIDIENAPDFCPMKISADVLKTASNEYEKEEIKEFAREASIQEAQCYEMIDGQIRTKLPRIEETIQFAERMKYKKLGLVFCAGLGNETLIINKILENRGFQVVSVCCKVGAIPKDKIGFPREQIVGDPERCAPMCNPIAQAEVMNKEKPDWVILVGLCVGHDTLFLKYCKRPRNSTCSKG
ncbi:DUF1847 domain-containing protein [Chloroflexota bacterium]